MPPHQKIWIIIQRISDHVKTGPNFGGIHFNERVGELSRLGYEKTAQNNLTFYNHTCSILQIRFQFIKIIEIS